MKCALAVLLFLFVSAGCQSNHASHADGGQARHQGGGDDAAAKAAVAATADRYIATLVKNDIPALERLWADDLVFVNPRGQVRTKAQRLADLKAGTTVVKSIDRRDVSVRICAGVAALHTSIVKLDATYGGKASSGEFRTIIAMCRHEGGEWRIHSIQLTPMTPE